MTASVAAAQKAARACFKPEYQALAALLDESILRNPEGWETWFAIKNDETDSARTQRVSTAPAAQLSFSDRCHSNKPALASRGAA